MNDMTATIERPHVQDMRPSGALGWAIGSVVVLALALVSYFLFWSGPAQPVADDQSRPVLAVNAIGPMRVTWPVTLAAQGGIAAWQEASIGTQIGSYKLIDIRVNVGDSVRRGQVLARLDPALLRAEEAQLVARYDQAMANDARARGLQGVGGISDQEALQFATEARTARALLAAKRLELRYTMITAPDDGTISARTATLGAVMPTGQELFRMIRRNRLEWRGELTAQQLNAVKQGQRIALTLPDGSAAQATVRQIAPGLEVQSRLAIVYADLVRGSAARAGMYATGAVIVGDASALIVPAASVVIRDGRSYVFRLEGAGNMARVALRAVTTGRRQGEDIEIVRGLTGGERLVARGGGFLNDGDLVRVTSTKAQS